MTTEMAELSETTTFAFDENTTKDWELTTTATIDLELTTTLQNIDITTESSIHYERTQADDDLFVAFNILEIVMTSMELMLWIGAAIKMPRWRNNYRNQMLIQLSVARFIKRLIFALMYLEHKAIISWKYLPVVLNSSQIYIDFVIVILVFFFIKHMYDSLIIVLVKCRQNSLYKISICAWLLPAPISAVWTAIIVYHALREKTVYLLICYIFRWPLIFIGTALYITILIRVLSDKIRRFARSLTVVTFLMCLVINFYLVSKDIIELWCVKSTSTILLSNVSGIVMNFLILTFYVILITMDWKNCSHSTPRNMRSLNSFAPDFSITETHNFKI